MDHEMEQDMRDDEQFDQDRRLFLTRLLPGCALSCAGLGGALAIATAPANAQAQVQPLVPAYGYAHKFDLPFSGKLTMRDHMRTQYKEMVELIRALTGQIGKSSLMQMIRTISEEKSLVMGATLAEKVPVNDFAAFIASFRDPGYQQIMTMQVVEDTPASFEMKVTECLWAQTFQELEAADIGYLYLCHADHTWAEGFNAGIVLTRDQTLMQGHALCNHRYTWKG